jgi:hypothetical protein
MLREGREIVCELDHKKERIDISRAEAAHLY